MKKTLAMLLALCMVFALCACGAPAPAAAPAPATEAAPAEEAAPVEEAAPAEEAPNAEELVSDALIDPLTEWATYDDLIAQIKAETDYAKRAELMHQAEDILMANYCVIPLYYYNDIYLQKDYVSGIYKNMFDTKFFMYAEMANGADTLKLNLASEPDYLDPALNSSVDGACLAANCFSGLYTYNSDLVTAPACAKGYTVSDDGLTYTVSLKDGLKWSDGSALTAADFEYSWKRAVAEETAADYAYMFDGFARDENGELCVKALDNFTLEFVLTAPCAYIEDLMAFPTFYPVNKAAVEANADPADPGKWCKEAGFVSNGAYVCTEWNHDVSMTYEKNPYFWDAENVKIEKLQFMLSADDVAIFSAYNAGDIDFADTVPTDEVANLLDNPEFYIMPSLGTYYAAFNCKSALFADKTPAQAAAMREAFSLLIDRDYICENVGQTGQIAANSFIPIGMLDGNGNTFKANAEDGYYDAYAINNDYDATVAKAIELLKSAGYKFNEDGTLSEETPIQIEYLTNESTGHIAVAESMQQDFAALGIEMTISVQDWNVFLEERKNGNFDFAREGWIADFNDPINMLEMWITDSGNNDCQFGR